MNWRLIETAPKDGTWIIVFDPDDYNSKYRPQIHVVQWEQPQYSGGGKTWVTMALGPNPDTHDCPSATHWMPLPAPPAGQ